MRNYFQSEKEEADKLYKMAKEEVDREQSALMKKMIEKQEHDIRLTKIIAFAECSLLIVLIVVFLVMIPRFFTTVKKVEATMEDVNELIDTSQKSLENIQDLVADADDIMMKNEQSIANALENFNKVDFDSLNRSIASLGDIMQPILEVLKVFDNFN
jgi:predicted PurR-regulated permease PerM